MDETMQDILDDLLASTPPVNPEFVKIRFIPLENADGKTAANLWVIRIRVDSGASSCNFHSVLPKLFITIDEFPEISLHCTIDKLLVVVFSSQEV